MSDTIKGKVKEVVAEVIGDEKLAEEGKAQQREPRIPKPAEIPTAES